MPFVVHHLMCVVRHCIGLELFFMFVVWVALYQKRKF